jgi:hypothetical protein
VFQHSLQQIISSIHENVTIYTPETEIPNETSKQNDTSPSQTTDAEAERHMSKVGSCGTDYFIIMKLSPTSRTLPIQGIWLAERDRKTRPVENNRPDAQVPDLSQPST